MKITTIKLLGSMLVIAGGALLSSASADYLYWSGSANDLKLDTPGNWNSGATPPSSGAGNPSTRVPDNRDWIIFNGTNGATLALTSTSELQPFIYQFYGTTAYTLTGGTLRLANNNPAFENYSATVQTIASDINGDNRAVTIKNGIDSQGSLMFSGTWRNFIRILQTMNGGTLTIHAINNGAADVTIAGANIDFNHSVLTGVPLTKNVIGNITGNNFGNAYGTGMVYGEIWLTGSNNLTGATMLNDGNLVLDYDATDAIKLGYGNSGDAGLSVNGGRIFLNSGTTREVVGNFIIGNYNYQVSAGNVVIDRSDDSSASILVNNIWRSNLSAPAANYNSNSTLDIRGDDILLSKTNLNSAQGIFATWITVGGEGSTGRDWATGVQVVEDAGTYYAIRAFTDYKDGTSVDDNVYIVGSSTIAEDTTMNSLKLSSTASDPNNNVFNLAGNTLTVKTGGLIYVGAENYTVTGGTLQMGLYNTDSFMVWQSGLGELTIDSDIVASYINKAGQGTLTLGGQFVPSSTTYGYIALNDGVLKLGADWGDSTKHMVLMPTSGTLNLNGHDLRVLAVGTDGQSASPAVITNDSDTVASLIVAPDGASAVWLGGLITAGFSGNVRLDIDGGGANVALTTYRANTHTGGVTLRNIAAATLVINNSGWFGTGTTELTGNAGFQVSYASPEWTTTGMTNDLRITGSNNYILTSQYIRFSNKWTGDGSLTLEGNNLNKQAVNESAAINGDLSEFTGDLKLQPTPAGGNNYWTFFTASNAVADWSQVNLTMENNGTTQTAVGRGLTALTLQTGVENQVFKIGNLSTNSTVTNSADLVDVIWATGNAGLGGAAVVLRSGVANGISTFEVGALNLSGTFDGNISNYGQYANYSFIYTDVNNYVTALTKVGSGTLTLSNTNTYTGTTTVSGGVLLVSGSGALTRTAGVNVSAGGAFIYDSAVALDRAVNVSAGGIFGGSGDVSTVNLTLAPNAELTGGGVLSTGTLTLTQALTLDDFIYQWDIAADDDYDQLIFSDGLTLDGTNYTVNVNALNGLGGLGDFEDLIILSGLNDLQASDLALWSLNQEAAAAGFTLGLSLDYTSLLLNYSAIPEPSTWALIVTGVALLAILRRRR
ncbi:MAG: PEP-CTERM sorting domain-containing protein [Verrucomicrobiales bacterium]|jgi:autotransporter-associated beta strand protein|nr:PEP-CTERM sorting domain-containing protein [Verrucomicrobiales bacterium]